MKKAFAINGSPRAGGNTEILLKKVLEPLAAAGWETEYLRIGGKQIRGCSACMKCVEKRDGKCILPDDGINGYLQKMFAADAIIIGSPTYFGDVTAELKAFIDRTGFVALANGGAFSGKIGAAVVAVRRGGATHVFQSINNLFLISSMIVPGSLYWNFGVGCRKEEVLGDQEGLANMDHLGKTIAWLGTALASHSEKTPFPKIAKELK